MTTKVLSVIISYVYLSLVQGSAKHTSHRNDGGGYGGRILHGHEANSQDFLFTVRLESGPSFCGGAIISNHWILTAAHCVVSNECKKIGISPSTWVVGDDPKYYAIECIPHRDYQNSPTNDIAMIETREDLVKDAGLEIITLPDPDAHFYPGTPTTIAGWGLTELGSVPPWLIRGEMTVITLEACDQQLKNSNVLKGMVGVPKKAFCVIGEPPLPDGACSGDSGGPMVSQNVLAGVIVAVRTDVEGKCIIGSAVLGLAVVEYLSWIQANMEPRDNSPLEPRKPYHPMPAGPVGTCAHPSRRVVNGMKADPNKWLFTVRLEPPLSLCGGSIIKHHWILTAAHCIYGKNCKAVKISPSNWKEGDKPKFHAIACIPHEYYQAGGYSNDIALIRTAEDLVTDGGLQTIVMPGTDDHFATGTPATIAGWGDTFAKTTPPYLLCGDMKVYSWDDCNPRFKEWEAIEIERIPWEALCVIGHEPKPDGSCFGDSGGPIVSGGKLAGVIVAGIHDRDNRCLLGTPTLGLAVPEYRPWINMHLQSDKNILKKPRSPVTAYPSLCSLRRRRLGQSPVRFYR